MKYVSTHDKDAMKKLVQMAINGERYDCSDAIRTKLSRYKYIHDTVKAYRTSRQIDGHEIRRKICQDLAKEFAVSISQAYVDWEMAATYLELEDPLPNKMVALKITIAQIDEMIEESRAAGDMRSAAALTKSKLAAIALQPDQKAADWTQVGFPKVVAVFDPKLIKSKVDMDLDQLNTWIDRIQEKERKASDVLGYLAVDSEFQEVKDDE